jgi:tRNA(Arg) A34 adenosine deaminase TadA
MIHSNEDYMRMAITAAVDSQASDGVAIGAVLVDNTTGVVVATGGSQVGPAKDPTAHAEINAIRAAAQRLGSDDLTGLTLYSTLEPCHMCLSAAAWARIQQVFFGAYRKDVDETLFDIKGDFSDEQESKRMNLRENLTMTVHGGVLGSQCAELLAKYHELPKHSGRVA